MSLAKISDAGLRRQLADAIKLLLSKHFDL
jgi:hypothetical protein